MLFDVIVGSAQHHIADLLIITTQVTPAAVPKGKRLKYDLCIKQDFRRNVLWENKHNIHEYICTSVFTIPAQTTKAFALQQDEKERRMSVVKDTALYYYSPELPENCVYWRHGGKGV